jgi:hypothetical protein
MPKQLKTTIYKTYFKLIITYHAKTCGTNKVEQKQNLEKLYEHILNTVRKNYN